MAERVVEEVPIRRSLSAAAALALLALLVAVVALVLVFRANHRANATDRQLTNLTHKLNSVETHVNSALGSGSTPTSGAGVGPNNTQAVPSTNPTPNGNGQ